jgi:methylase of polypeptide subunit release factors
MGSGSVGEAALKNGRRFLGTDVNPAAVRVTGERLQKFGEGRQPDLGEIAPADLLSLMGTET